MKTGHAIMSDGQTNSRGHSLTNFLVNSPSGIVIIRSIGTTDAIKDANKIYKLFDSVLDEICKDSVI